MPYPVSLTNTSREWNQSGHLSISINGSNNWTTLTYMTLPVGWLSVYYCIIWRCVCARKEDVQRKSCTIKGHKYLKHSWLGAKQKLWVREKCSSNHTMTIQQNEAESKHGKPFPMPTFPNPHPLFSILALSLQLCGYSLEDSSLMLIFLTITQLFHQILQTFFCIDLSFPCLILSCSLPTLLYPVCFELSILTS